jgi:hypothetical protein
MTNDMTVQKKNPDFLERRLAELERGFFAAIQLSAKAW